MSAGGISFDCLTTSRKATLPSTDSWGTNMNIIQDPNRGIYTRRKDKVGETQEVLLAQEDSGDRIAECINVYARGVNPMVSVSYNNYGTNGGQTSGLRGHGGVKLPYRPEVFRPPVFRQEDLVPLSRLPRNWFYALTNPQAPYVAHEMKCPDSKSSIQTKKLHYEAPSNKQYMKQLPIEHDENLNKKEVADSILSSNDVHTGKSQPYKGNFQSTIEHFNPKHVERNKNFYNVFSNKQSIQRKNMIEPHQLQAKSTHESLLKGEISANKYIDKKVSWGETVEFKDGRQVKRDILHNNVMSSKGNRYNTIDHIQDGPRREGQNPKLNVESFTRPTLSIDKNSHEIATTGNIQDNVLQLADGVNTTHSGMQKNVILDPSNIQLRETPCISVSSSKSKNIHQTQLPMDLNSIPVKDNLNISMETTKSQNIHKNTGPVDLSTIQLKELQQMETNSCKTYLDKNDWFGQRPEHRMRVLQTEMDTGLNRMEMPTEFYEHVQGFERKDVQQKMGSVGSFDPRPQNMASSNRYEPNLNDSSMINQRQSSLQKSVNEQFQQRYNN